MECAAGAQAKTSLPRSSAGNSTGEALARTDIWPHLSRRSVEENSWIRGSGKAAAQAKIETERVGTKRVMFLKHRRLSALSCGEGG